MKRIRFTESLVWQRAHQYVLATYKFSAGFPTAERYGLTSQLRRAAISIPANFVEGFRRFTPTEKIRFYNIAQGSAEETRYYLILARDLGYGDSGDLMELLEEVLRLLQSYIAGMRKKLEDLKKPSK